MTMHLKSVLFFGLILSSLTSIAQVDVLGQLVPVQQFVTAEPDSPPPMAESAGNLVNEANKRALRQPHPFAQNPIAPPASAPFPNMETNPIFESPPPAANQQLPSDNLEENTPELGESVPRVPAPLTSTTFEEEMPGGTNTTDFAGGLDENMFSKCAILVEGVCSKATDDEGFQKCIKRLQAQPACGQFMKFASMSGFGPNDDVDFVQYYKEGQLTLVHVIRMGQNYPGDYYTIGADGSFLNITAGKQIQHLNMTKDVRYPQIIARYPKAQIWSVIEQLPMASASPDGGLRLIFRFALLNGCATCDKAGYANVAYDFSGSGSLVRVGLLSLDPILAQ